MSEESDIRVLSNTMSRFEIEMRSSLSGVRQGQEKVQDQLDELRNNLPEKFLSRREHEDWRRTVGERVGETELELASLRKDMNREFEKRDSRLDANRKLALTGLVFPIVTGVVVGGLLALVQVLSG